MAHVFEVGKMYRNRLGEYTVLALDGDKMTIRYVNGATTATSASIQARIWENIQFEEQAAREEERQRLAQEARLASRKRAEPAAGRPEVARRARGRFSGFQESDFQPKARGLAWSGRVALGGLLATELSRRTGEEFAKWLVPLQPEVHIAGQGHYDPDVGNRNAAFFVAITEKTVSYGFRVGKPDGPVDAGWPWSSVLAALGTDEQLREVVESAMKARDLSLDLYAMDVSYGPLAHVTASGQVFHWEHETAQQVSSRDMNWSELLKYLRTAAPEVRADLYLRKVLPKEAVIGVGPAVARDMVSVFASLMPLYDASSV